MWYVVMTFLYGAFRLKSTNLKPIFYLSGTARDRGEPVKFPKSVTPIPISENSFDFRRLLSQIHDQ